jgi:hypothetical protein
VHDQRKLAAAVLAERHGDVLLAHTAKYAVDRAVRSEEARQQREACAYLPWVSDHEVLLEAMCALGDDEFCQAAAERYITVAGLDAARAVVERQVVTPATFECVISRLDDAMVRALSENRWRSQVERDIARAELTRRAGTHRAGG